MTHQAQLCGLPSDWALGSGLWALGVDYNTNQQTNYPLSKGAFDTEQLALITALRYDHIDFEFVDHAAQARLNKRRDAITGRLGLVYDLTSNVSLYTQYSTSTEPPGGTLTSASISQVGDFDLSTGRQIEVGSKFDFLDGRGSTTAAAYRIVRRNISVPSSTVPNTTGQAGQQTSTGIELAASFKITPKLLAAGNFS